MNLSVHKRAYACICICVCMYACICACVYVCVCIYVCLCICMHIHLYTPACECKYALLGAFCLFVLSNLSNTCACVCMGGLEVGLVSACSWLARVSGVGGYVLGGVETGGFVLYISLFSRVLGWWVCVCWYTRVHTQTTWVLDVSPGVGWTPGEPEESRSTKAQYTCRPYR